MALREEGKERRRRRIFDATIEILMQDGLSGLTVAKIADGARVSVATIYNLIGPLDLVISTMLSEMFEEFEALRLESGDPADPIDAIYRFSGATVEHWGDDPERYRAMLRAVFQLNMSQPMTEPVLRIASRNQLEMSHLIERARELGLLREEANARLLAEQMLTAQIALFQAWSVSLISLERYRVSCLLSFSTVLRAWATRKLAPRLDQTIRELDEAFNVADAAAGPGPRRAMAT
jgi:AcrR family transcriptional regulator